jgi:hypothetical protein
MVMQMTNDLEFQFDLCLETEYGKTLVTKQAHTKLSWPMRRLHKWYYLVCVCVTCNLSIVLFLKQFSRVQVLTLTSNYSS